MTSYLRMLPILLFLGTPLSLAQPAAFVVGSAPDPSISQHVGVAGAVRGDVTLTRGKEAGRNVQSGEAVYENDVITTGPDATVQIILKDQTIFTIGKDSSVVIHKFGFDENTNEGEIHAEVLDGVFRFVTGKIAEKKPEKMEIQLPTGIMGVRGTIGIVKSSLQTKESTAVLLGPGSNTNTQHKKGALVLKNDVQEGGKTVTKATFVGRTGFASKVAPGKAPTLFEMPADQLRDMTQAVGGGSQKKDGDDDGGGGGDGKGGDKGGDDDAGGGNEGGGESAASQAGQDTAGGADSAGDFSSVADATAGIAEDSIKASQDAAREAAGVVATNRTQYEELLDFSSGTLYFQQNGNSMGGAGSNFDVDLHIHLDTRVIDGDISNVRSGTLVDADNAMFTLSSVNYSGLSGDVNVAWSNLTDVQSGTPCGGNCTADVTFNAFNEGSSIAHSGTVSVKLKGGAGSDFPTGEDTGSTTIFSSLS